MTPALATAYAMLLPAGRRPATEATLTIRPAPRARRCGAAARARKNGPRRFTSWMWFQMSTVSASRSRNGTPAFHPALLTRMSSRPNSPSTVSTADGIDFVSLTSSWIIAARRPRRATRRHVLAAPCLKSIHVTATSAPASASATATARPRSPDPPVTSAAVPSRSTGLGGSSWRREVRDAELARALVEPRDHFLVQRDAVGAPLLRFLEFRETRIEDTLLARRGRRRSQPFEHLVHRVLELFDVGERGDVVGGEVVLAAAAGRKHRRQRAGEHGREHLGHEGQAIALVRALLSHATERQLVKVLAIEDWLLLRDRRAVLVRDPAGEQRRAQPNGEPDLVAGDRGRRRVEEHRRLAA